MDINKPHFLSKIVSGYDFNITPIVDGEVKKKLRRCKMGNNYQHITNSPITKISHLTFRPEVIIAPFLSANQKMLGEHEVIAHSYGLEYQQINFCFILDDKDARDFVSNNTTFRHLRKMMKWTTDLIQECGCASKILSKQECIQLITDMKAVKSLKVPLWRWSAIESHIQSC